MIAIPLRILFLRLVSFRISGIRSAIAIYMNPPAAIGSKYAAYDFVARK